MFAIESHVRCSIANRRGLSDSDRFYCDKRSRAIWGVPGSETSSLYFGEYTSGLSGPAALQLAAPPSSCYEGNLGQAPRRVEIL